MFIVAWIHTEGVILKNKYYVLELAYEDITGIRKVFLIKSPISYTHALKENKYLHKSLEVIMVQNKYYKNYKVYHFKEIIEFLRQQYFLFKYHYHTKSIFAYKGKQLQRDILQKSNIPAINLENFNYPSISQLAVMFPNISKTHCDFHMGTNNKCAAHILNLFNAYHIS